MSTDNFVRIYDNCLPVEDCNILISEFKKAKQSSITTIHDPNMRRKDTSFLLYDSNKDLNDDFNQILNKYITQYTDDFPLLKDYKFVSFHNKMQETELSGGYHNWHCENNEIMTSSRILTWLFYLNNVDEGGETELLYQSIRVKPKAGRLVIFPAYFTHAHRGNPPISNTKYIATGWYHLTE